MYFFLIGLLMGIADLVPGISGGTVAFMCGIYEPLLENIKTLRFRSFKKNAYAFLIPLFSGIATSIFLFSKIVYLLFIHMRSPLLGLFFGMVVASMLLYGREIALTKVSHYVGFIIGGAIALFFTTLPSTLMVGSGFFWIMCAGVLGSAAMLLPGLSGSFVLQVLGVYPLILYALNKPTESASLKLLIAMGLGIALGLIFFSRLITFLLNYFRQITLSVLIGFMVGGLKVIWPFTTEEIFLPLSTLILGFVFVILLEISRLRKHKSSEEI